MNLEKEIEDLKARNKRNAIVPAIAFLYQAEQADLENLPQIQEALKRVRSKH